jgi:hypothetical protein
MLKEMRALKGASGFADKETVKSGETIFLPAHKGKFREISAFGDGNCGLNTFGLILINLILQKHQFRFTDDYDKRFIKAIIDTLPTLKQRLESYKRHDALNLIASLDAFIKFIEKNKQSLTFNQLEAYIRSAVKTSEQVAALEVGLAPGLRELGCDLYYESLQRDVASPQKVKLDAETEVDVANLRRDGVSTGQELLTPLAAKVFNLNLHIFQKNTTEENGKTKKSELIRIHTPNDNPSAPTVQVLNVNNSHWNCLIPADQKGGLFSCIPAVMPNANSAASSSAGFFKRSSVRVVDGKWTTEAESQLLEKNSKKEIIKKANAILIKAMESGSIADKKGNILQEKFVALFDSLENAVRNSHTLNDLLPKCKEFLNEKKSSHAHTAILNDLEKFIDSEVVGNQRSLMSR